MRSEPAAALAMAASVWLAALLLAPTLLSRGRLPFATFAVYEAGSRICHQRPERSFRWAGVQMPVCARCLGLYASAAFGAAFALIAGGRTRQWTPSARAAIAIAAVPMLLSVGLERLGGIESTNLSRFVSGMPFGAVLAWVFIRVVRNP